MIKRALISVSDKTGIVELALTLYQAGIEIISTGGTAKTLIDADIPVINISDVTGFPEMMDGRVKSLHPKIHGALLAKRNNPDHMNQALNHSIELIDLLVVNLYPFEQTVRKPDVTIDEAIENIDIGGPSMIRSAAKNFYDVCVVIDPDDYPLVAEHIAKTRDIPAEERYRYMIKAFEHTAHYDQMISCYFSSLKDTQDEELPDHFYLDIKKQQPLRYGENPHQSAAFYTTFDQYTAIFRQLHGKELSYNNLLDTDACARITAEFSEPVCVIVKHNNPCGVAIGSNLCEAFLKARMTDPIAAYGGIIGFNGTVDEAAAKELKELFVEVILAKGFDPAALGILQKKKNVRLLEFNFDQFRKTLNHSIEIRRALNGYLIQTVDNPGDDLLKLGLKSVSARKPTDSEMRAMMFGWKIVRHVKSNAIVLCNQEQTIGIGAGQMSRIDSVRLAISKAGQAGFNMEEAILASDAFFPFRDNIDESAIAGIAAVIQPGGSVNDQDVLDAVNQYNMTMVITNLRHFRH